MILTQNENFKSYLAGLIEGDGSFVVPSALRDSKNRLRYAKIKTAFAKRDKPLAERLKSYYGGHFEEHDNYIVWSLTQKQQILSICADINGWLRTPKWNDFHNLIEFMKIQDPSLNFEILPLNETSIDSDAWLAGFTDADGNFNLTITRKKNNKKRVQIQFRIEVREFFGKTPIKNSTNFSSFVPICNTIAEHFGLGIYHRTRKQRFHSVIIVSTSFLTNSKVVDYFEKFPLFSAKYLDFVDWKTVHNLQEKKLHLTQDGYNLCEKIKQNYNSSRSQFSWVHLENFYIYK